MRSLAVPSRRVPLSRSLKLYGAVACLAFVAHDAAAQADPTVRSQDTLLVTVAGQPELSLKYVVRPDGTVDVPLVGSVLVMNLTASEVSAELERRLEPYLREPDVSVAVERSGQIFVFGQVTSPGTYELTPDMTLLEALARAGYRGASQVFVVRGSGAAGPQDQGPGTEDQGPGPGDAIVVNLRDLEQDVERGELSRNLVLADGDTIFVPYFDPNLIRVSGEVRSPGAFSVPDGTTVLQAVTLAGGATERAALGRAWLVRLEGGRTRTIGVDLQDEVRRGDSIFVPETVLPLFVIGETDFDPDRRLPLQLRAGNTFIVTPAFALRRIGIDTNVFNTATDRREDFIIVAGPELDVVLNLDRLRLRGQGEVDYVYFRRTAGERSTDWRYSAGADVAVTPRLTLTATRAEGRSRDRLNYEVDARVRRFERSAAGGVSLHPGERLELEVEASERQIELDEGASFLGVSLRQTLTQELRGVSATARYALTPLSALVFSGAVVQHRYPFAPIRNADATELTAGVRFRPQAVLSGSARVGHLRYVPLQGTARAFEGLGYGAGLSLRVRERTVLGAIAERRTGAPFQPQFSYGIVDRYGGSVALALSRRLDAQLGAYRETFSRVPVGQGSSGSPVGQGFSPAGTSSEQTLRVTAGLGVRLAGAARLSFDGTYIRRLAAEAPAREYDGLQATLGLSLGVLRVAGR